jgi:hypothetical protein
MMGAFGLMTEQKITKKKQNGLQSKP